MITDKLLLNKLDEAAALLQSRKQCYRDRDRLELVGMGWCQLGGHRRKHLTERYLFYRCVMAICLVYQVEIGVRHANGKKRVYPNKSLSFLNTELPESYQLTTVQSNEKDIDNKEYAHHLLAVTDLTDRQRQVIDMRFTDDMKFVAIGEKMGFTSTTAKNILNKALAKMRYKAN